MLKLHQKKKALSRVIQKYYNMFKNLTDFNVGKFKEFEFYSKVLRVDGFICSLGFYDVYNEHIMFLRE
jgi:hypothetical protein